MKKNIVPIIAALILLAGCSSRELIQKNYYILEYYPQSEDAHLHQAQPLDFTVLVSDTRIPTTYNRKEIVIRHFGPRITYADNDIWAVDLSEIIPNLIVKRASRYNLFKQVQRDFLNLLPDYEISTRINNIELFESEEVKVARLNMDFSLKKTGAKTNEVEYSFDREVNLVDQKVETYVQTINDIVLQETDRFYHKILVHFGSLIAPAPEKRPLQAKSDIRELEITESAPKGMGLLLMPAITKSDNEPPYKIYDQDRKEIPGIMGEPIPLPEGIYTVKYGSGSVTQLMTRDSVKIIPRYKTIIEPDWSCMIVDIIDEKRNFAKVRYEIFDAETGESYGTEFPAEKEVGEQQKVWVLPSELYKVTINNEPFNTYRDFTTIGLEPGEVQKLTIVVDTDEEGNPANMVGAGILEGELVAAQGKWRFINAVYGNANVNSDNEKERDTHETTVTLNTQFENKIIYDNFPLYYIMKNLTELGTTKSSDTDFRISTDDFYFRNTFIIYFLKNVGFYGRLDAESHLFNEYFHSPTEFNYIKRNTDDNTIEQRQNVTQIRLKQGLSPLTLKEGIGINYRMFNTTRANLNLRVGFGMRQDLNRNVYNLSEATKTIDDILYRVYLEKESTSKEGTELSIVGNFQLPFNLTYYTNADFLFPFEKSQEMAIEWENTFNIKIFKHISLDYKIRLRNKPADGGSEYIVDRHTLFLRITYFLR